MAVGDHLLTDSHNGKQSGRPGPKAMLRPLRHQKTPLLEMIGSVIGSLDLALDDIGGGRWTVIILCRGYGLLIQPILG